MFGLGEGAWETLYDGLELTLGAGQIVAVIGPSGCGKSVLLGKVLGAARGAVVVRTEDLARSEKPAVEVVAAGRMQGAWVEVLSRCGLAEAAVLVTPARCLSAGQLYRLALARAFWEIQRRVRRRARSGRVGVIVARVERARSSARSSPVSGRSTATNS